MMMSAFVLAMLAHGAAGGNEHWTNPAERYADVHKQFADVQCPIPESGILHFVYFARDRDAMRDHPLLISDRFSGAQIMYPWSLLEPEAGVYDFSIVLEDLEFLKRHGKKLFVQLQDATFHPSFKATPTYLHTQEYGGGVVPQIDDEGKREGWVARRWDEGVQSRFIALLNQLGKAFNGEIEGINLQETAINVEKSANLSSAQYAAAIRRNMRALGRAFPDSTTLQYANFFPGEWLPWEDEGYLKSAYDYGEQIGVGLGAPDLIMDRRGQLNHALAMMHEGQFTVPLGIAIQDGNYIGKTGTNEIQAGRKSLVAPLHAFAQSFLKVDYIFWANQEPYFREDVLPCFGGLPPD